MRRLAVFLILTFLSTSAYLVDLLIMIANLILTLLEWLHALNAKMRGYCEFYMEEEFNR